MSTVPGYPVRRGALSPQQLACNQISSKTSISFSEFACFCYVFVSLQQSESLLSSHHTSTPHSSSSATSTSSPVLVTTWFPYAREAPWLTYTTEVNVLWWVALALAFLTRFWRIDFPHYVMSVHKHTHTHTHTHTNFLVHCRW